MKNAFQPKKDFTPQEWTVSEVKVYETNLQEHKQVVARVPSKFAAKKWIRESGSNFTNYDIEQTR